MHIIFRIAIATNSELSDKEADGGWEDLILQPSGPDATTSTALRATVTVGPILHVSKSTNQMT